MSDDCGEEFIACQIRSITGLGESSPWSGDDRKSVSFGSPGGFDNLKEVLLGRSGHYYVSVIVGECNYWAPAIV